MTHRGTDNLRCYVREATLPKMISASSAPPLPMDGHKSHMNTLAIRPEYYRQLESMYRFKDEAFDEVITNWVDNHIPEYSLGMEDDDEITGERLSVPVPGIFSIPSQTLIRPSDIIRLSLWLDSFPLQTVLRIMHIIYPATSEWGFSQSGEKESDDALFRNFLWTSQSAAGSPPSQEIGQHSVVIAYQAPWVLSSHDLQRFIDCRTFPSFDPNRKSAWNPLQSKERLWGKLWDVCVRNKCPWFVLSSYTGWCFGAFSKGWTKAYVSGMYNFDSCSPTILECLLFWIVSAMDLPGGWRIPEVGFEPPHNPPEYQCSVYDVCMMDFEWPMVPEPVVNFDRSFSIPSPPRVARYDALPSESSWDGKSDATGDSAGLLRPLSPVVSDCGLPTMTWPLQMPHPQRDTLNKVFEWTKAVVPPNPFPPYQPPPSPPLSDWSSSSSSSTSTVLDLSGREYCGDWLIAPAMENELFMPFSV